MEWNTLAPMASLMSAGDVLVQYDQQFERYDIPNPQQVALELATTPPGSPTRCPTAPRSPTSRACRSSTRRRCPGRPTRGGPPPLVSYTVDDPRPIVRTESLAHPLVVDGDADGLVSRLVGRAPGREPDHPLRRHPRHRPKLRPTALGGPADLVVTDTNRKQAFEWNTLSENTGYTETATQGADTTDPKDAPIDLFPKAPARRPDHRRAGRGRTR